MIRILIRLLPDEARPAAAAYAAMLAAVTVTRAITCVLLVPLLGRLLSDNPGAATGWIVAFVAVAALNALVQHRMARAGFALGLSVTGHVQHRMLDQLVVMPLGWPTGSRRASTQRALSTTTTTIAQTIGNLVGPLVMAVSLPIAIAVALVFVSWPVGLAALVAAPLLLAAWWGTNRCTQRADAAFAASVEDLDDRIGEFARVQRALRGARRADPDDSLVGNALDTQHTATVSLLRWSVPGRLLFSIASQLALLTFAVVALDQLRRGNVTVPEALGLLVVTVRFLEPFTVLGELAPALQATTSSLRAVDAIIDAPVLTGGTAVPLVPDGAVPEVRFDSVSFRYPGATAVTLDGVDFVAPAGATTAIVGPSGAGKSTILGLIARFFDVDRGHVRVGGTDVGDRPPGDLYAELSVVFQNVHLFEGTIADNVRLARPDATDAELAEMAARSRVDEIVARLPNGWDTAVGEGGVAVSGGERQRIGIARALLKAAPLLLVDEATSSLDPENEAAIAATLAAGRGARTTIVVAHRMATIEQADHIVFIDNGRVVESGPRHELLATGGRFAAFHRERAATAAWTVRSADG